MTQHACPFCAAKLDVAAVPPGDWLRCGKCFYKLERGETALSLQEVQAYRKRRKLRRAAIVVLATFLPIAVLMFMVRSYSDPNRELFSREPLVLVTYGVLGVLSLVWPVTDWLRSRAPVPVAPVADKVQG